MSRAQVPGTTTMDRITSCRVTATRWLCPESVRTACCILPEGPQNQDGTEAATLKCKLNCFEQIKRSSLSWPRNIMVPRLQPFWLRMQISFTDFSDVNEKIWAVCFSLHHFWLKWLFLIVLEQIPGSPSDWAWSPWMGWPFTEKVPLIWSTEKPDSTTLWLRYSN